MTVLAGRHTDRPVHLESRGAETVVVKHYLAGGASRIHDDMCALWSSSFGAIRRPPGMPRPIGVDADLSQVEMQYLPGEAIGSRGDLGQSVRLLPEVGRLLADLHGSGVQVQRRRGPSALLRSARRKVDDLNRAAGIDPDQRAAVELADRVLHALGAALPPSDELVVSHGDFSPRNVLLTPAGLALIDFDRLQMAAPQRDIAYWGAWTWVTMLTSGQQPSWDVADELTRVYSLTRPLRDTGSGVPAFYRALALLRIAHGWSALQAAPATSALVLREALRILANAHPSRHGRSSAHR